MRGLSIFLFSVFFLGSIRPAVAGERETLVIVGLGDSTTAGTPAFRSPLEVPPGGEGNPESQYGFWLMKRHPEWRFLNRGVNGERSDEILARFDSDVLRVQPDVVIILAGVNDLYQGHPLEPIKNNLKEMYTRAREAGIRVMACTVLPYNISTDEVRFKMAELNDWIRSYAGEQGLEFCDTHQAVADPGNPGRLVSTADNLHPDVAAYRKMGEAISESVRKHLSTLSRK